jgi:hypothetical protein
VLSFQAIELDCRELEAPEPMERVLNNLYKIDEQNYIKMIHRIEPMMLYPVLQNNGYSHHTVLKNETVFIYIYKNPQIKEYLLCLQD